MNEEFNKKFNIQILLLRRLFHLRSYNISVTILYDNREL